MQLGWLTISTWPWLLTGTFYHKPNKSLWDCRPDVTKQARGYKTFFIINSAEHAINLKMPTTVGILTFMSIINTTPEVLKARNVFICRYFSFYEQFKYRAQLSWAWKMFYNFGAWSALLKNGLMFDLILYAPSTIFQLYRDGSSWVEPVLS